MDIQIVPFVPGDLEEASRVFYQIFGPDGCGEGWTPETSKQMLAENTGEKSFTFCAKKDGVIIGLVNALPMVREKGEVMFVNVICVTSREQGQGVGKKLWKKVEEIARASGMHGVYLLANKKNPSYRWYESLHFSETGWTELSLSLT